MKIFVDHKTCTINDSPRPLLEDILGRTYWLKTTEILEQHHEYGRAEAFQWYQTNEMEDA